MTDTQVEVKVKTKTDVEEVWLADHRLHTLAKYQRQAMKEGEYMRARRVEEKCEKIKRQIFAKYHIIL